MYFWNVLFMRVLIANISILILLSIFDLEDKNIPFYLFLIAVMLWVLLA
jgi:hypothetical protein